MLDRIDGGFSLFLHVPGFLPPNTDNNKTVLDGYLPPREVMTQGSMLEVPLGRIIHTFLQDIATPHLRNSRGYREASNLPIEVTEVQKDSRASSDATFFVLEPSSSHFLFQDKPSASEADDSFGSFDQAMELDKIVAALNEQDSNQSHGPGKCSCHSLQHL